MMGSQLSFTNHQPKAVGSIAKQIALGTERPRYMPIECVRRWYSKHPHKAVIIARAIEQPSFTVLLSTGDADDF